MTGSDKPRRRRSRRQTRTRVRRALLVGLVVGSLLLTTAGWVGFRGWQARGHLLNAAGLARDLSAQVVGGDAARAQRTLAALQVQAAAARSATADPGWWVGRQAPYAGDDLAAVHQVAVAVDDLARHAFPVLLRTDLTVLLPREGRLDLAGLRLAATDLARADEAVQRVRTGLSGVPVARLVPQVRAAVATLVTEVDRLGGLTGAASRGARVLPPLLGAEGSRDYLLVSQNPAEVRATGGMFGAYALVRAEGGRVAIVTQGTAAADLRRFTPPVRTLSPEMRNLYTDLPAIYPADVNLTPHFPTAAALYREMFRRRTGESVDGVLATDPVALSYLLRATGPVTVPGYTTLTSGKVVQTLLSDSYRQLDLKRQDEFFAAAGAAVFDTFLRRDVDLRVLMSAFDRAITERRMLFWSARPEEQRALDDSRVTGTLPERETEPTVGVFLNDGSGAKLGYYLKPEADLTVGPCRPDGRRELRLTVTLGSSAPKSGLTRSVLGAGMAGDPYTVRTLVYVFSPAGGAVVGARLNGVEASLGSGTERGRQVGVAQVDVAPGGTGTLEVSVLTAKTGTGAADLWLTPTATPWTTHISSAPNCDQ